MKVTLESTTKVVTLNGHTTRVWEGETERGIRCHAYIVRIAVHKDLDSSEFDRELAETRSPSPEIEILPLRFLL